MMKSIKRILTTQKGISMRFFHTVGLAFIWSAMSKSATGCDGTNCVMEEDSSGEGVKTVSARQMGELNIAWVTGYVDFGIDDRALCTMKGRR